MADGGVSAAAEVAGSEAATEPEEAAGRRSVKATFKGLSRPSSPFVIVLLLAILLSVVFFLSASALFVFGVGVALAFFLVPVVNSLEQRGMARWIAAIVVVIATVVLLVAVVGIVTVILLDQGIAFVANLPTILHQLETWHESLALSDWLRTGLDRVLLAIGAELRSLDQGLVIAVFAGGLVSLEDVKNLLGHSTIVLTSNTYGHVLEQRQQEMARGMDAVLGG